MGGEFPDFEAESTDGPIRFSTWQEECWCVVFAHPADFTPVCTSELGAMVRLQPALRQRNVKTLCISCDSLTLHQGWQQDIRHYSGLGSAPFPFPMIADPERKLARLLNIVDPDEVCGDLQPASLRATYIVSPQRRIRMIIMYPLAVGRSFGEVLRALDSLILCSKHRVATPENWRRGAKCFVLPPVDPVEAGKQFPSGVQRHDLPSNKPYMYTTQPPE